MDRKLKSFELLLLVVCLVPALPMSEALAEVVGKGPLPRTEVVKKIWAYIKKRKLQNPKNRREIIPDEKLAKIIGKKTINMFAMTKKLQSHLS